MSQWITANLSSEKYFSMKFDNNIMYDAIESIILGRSYKGFLELCLDSFSETVEDEGEAITLVKLVLEFDPM